MEVGKSEPCIVEETEQEGSQLKNLESQPPPRPAAKPIEEEADTERTWNFDKSACTDGKPS